MSASRSFKVGLCIVWSLGGFIVSKIRIVNFSSYEPGLWRDFIIVLYRMTRLVAAVCGFAAVSKISATYGMMRSPIVVYAMSMVSLASLR